MHVRDARFEAPLVAICLLALCGSARAGDDCAISDVLVRSWIRMSRTHVPGLPASPATRRELEFEAGDQVVLKGYSYSPASQGNDAAAKDFILLLQGSASSAAQLAETASGLALAAKREVFVYDYRGYAPESTVRPTAAAIQRDVDGIIDALARGGGRGVVIGMSLGGVFAMQSLKRSKSGDLRVLLDSVPARLPWVPFLMDCPRWMNPLDAATPEVIRRVGVLYGADDGWSRDSAARELVEKVQAGGGRVWTIAGGHVDLSFSGLAARLPIYVDFVRERTP